LIEGLGRVSTGSGEGLGRVSTPYINLLIINEIAILKELMFIGTI
jgi:hypothetical protein